MHSVLYVRSLFRRRSKAAGDSDAPKKYLDLEPGWWKLPVLFLLCLALYGLHFFPAIAFVAACIVYAWRARRMYDVLLMSTLFFGGFGFAAIDLVVIRPTDIALVSSLVLWLVMRKPPILKRTLMACAAYAASLFVFALLSIESLSVQILIMRPYLMFLCIIIPFAIFAKTEFVFDDFLRHALSYCLIISIFYIIDAYILSGNVLVPDTASWRTSTFYSPTWMPLSGVVTRKYPPGLYILALIILPLARSHKLKLWQWAVLCIGIISTQTFTLILACVLTYVLFQPSLRKSLLWIFTGIVGFLALYLVDSFLPSYTANGYTQSALRVKSSVDQVFDLFNAVDDEDIADFGSGRMAQVMPKLELVGQQHRELIGLGFLHPQKTHINQYIIVNDYYSDISQSIELATGVEVIPVQIYINIGWLGLLCHTIFFIWLWLIIRHLPLASYYLSVVFFNIVLGISGFAGLASPHGLLFVSIAYAAPILAARSALPGYTKFWDSSAIK